MISSPAARARPKRSGTTLHVVDDDSTSASGVRDAFAMPRAYRDALTETCRLERVSVRRQAIVAIVILVLLAAVPLLSSGSFDLDRYGVAVAYVMAALGLNLAFGFAGELAIGFAAIMAVGAYCAGMLSAVAGWSGVPALLGGTVAGTLFGSLTMLPGLRVQGWYLALLTMFSVLVVPHVVVLGEAWTGGEYGLTGVQAFDFFGVKFDGAATFELLVVAFAVMWWLQANFLRSGWGLRLRAIRDARSAAEAVGIPVAPTRAVVYVMAAAPAALSGASLAFAQRFVNYDAFNMSLTLLLLTGVVLGGAGRLWGPLVGMTPLLVLSFWVGPFSQYNAVVLGFGLLIGVLLFPDGLLTAFDRIANRRGASAPAPANVDGLSEAISKGSPRPVRTNVKPDAQTILVRARGVEKHFGGLKALNGVDFDLHQGKLCGLVGPNGSGKSTFLNTLSGFIRPDAGEILIGDANIAALAPHQIAAVGIGRTFQVPQLIDELSALENIELGLLAHDRLPLFSSLLLAPAVRRRSADRRENALRALALVGLPVSAVSQPVEKLPLGLKRTVEVARALVAHPKVLLLDEPAAGLNEVERDELARLLRLLVEDGITVLVVEHNVPFILSTCDELVLLEGGSVRARADLGEELPRSLAEYLNFIPPPELAQSVDKGGHVQ
jgi:ABC-type branched-subunit amino acid transport system ATPase component/ABC-type branched-subunit amino acid transport system permease subunit